MMCFAASNAWDKCSREDHSQNFTIRSDQQRLVDPGQTFAIILHKGSREDQSQTFTIKLDQQRKVNPGQTCSKLRVQLRSKSDNSLRSNREELILQVISKDILILENPISAKQFSTIHEFLRQFSCLFLPMPMHVCNVCVDKDCTLLDYCIVYTLKCKFPVSNPKCLHRQGKNFSP